MYTRGVHAACCGEQMNLKKRCERSAESELQRRNAKGTDLGFGILCILQQVGAVAGVEADAALRPEALVLDAVHLHAHNSVRYSEKQMTTQFARATVSDTHRES